MGKNELFALSEQIKKVCPPVSEVEVLPTHQDGEIYLIAVMFPKVDVDSTAWSAADFRNEILEKFFATNPILKKTYLWEKQEIHYLHYEKIIPLLKDAKNFRAVYCCGGKFIFYAHTFGCFERCTNQFDYVGLKSKNGEDFKYIGYGRYDDFVIDHLMTTHKKF